MQRRAPPGYQGEHADKGDVLNTGDLVASGLRPQRAVQGDSQDCARRREKSDGVMSNEGAVMALERETPAV